jgi:Fe-S-cluster-containing hydrogenase component 2
VAAGYRAARAIHFHLSGEWLPDIPRRPVLEDKRAKITDDTILTRRQRPKLRPAQERVQDFEEVSLGFSETLARAEARRCLTCVPCAACGRCTEICIYHAVSMEDGRPVISLDCDGCGLCTYLCPNEAIRMEPRMNADGHG